jgi:hypothetical protein
MTLIVVMVLQLALIRTDSNIIDLTLKLPAKVLLGLGSVVVSVVLAWLFLGVYDLGISGLVAGFIIGRLILTVAYPLMIGRMLDIAASSQLRGAVRPTLTTVVLLAGGAALADRLHVGSWLALVAACGVTLVACTAVVLVAGVPAARRHALINRLRRVAQLT